MSILDCFDIKYAITKIGLLCTYKTELYTVSNELYIKYYGSVQHCTLNRMDCTVYTM